MILLVLSNERKDSDDPIVKERDQAPKIELYGKGHSVTPVIFILYYERTHYITNIILLVLVQLQLVVVVVVVVVVVQVLSITSYIRSILPRPHY
jgi:hypothetical protein